MVAFFPVTRAKTITSPAFKHDYIDLFATSAIPARQVVKTDRFVCLAYCTAD